MTSLRLPASLAVLFLVLAGPSRTQGQEPAATVPANPVDPAIESAAKLLREGKAEEALAKIREASGAHKDWPSPMLIMARLCFASGQNDRGRLVLEQAAIEAPEDPSVPLTFAAIDLAEGRRHDARLNADLALSLAPKVNDPKQESSVIRDAQKILATLAELRQDWAAARDHLQVALQSAPKDGALHQSLGRVLFRLGKTEEAFAELSTAFQESPTLDAPEVLMALLYGRAGEPNVAEEWFQRALKTYPKLSKPRVSYAIWLLEQGRPDAAQPVAEEISAIEPDAKDLSKLRGLIAFHRRDLPVAEAIYEALAKEAPDDPAVTSMLALSLVDQQDRAKRARGLQIAESLARRFPRSSEILATLGHAHDRNGHPQDAEINLRAAISGGRAAAETAYFLALVLADRGRTDEARKLLTAAIQQPGLFAYRKEAADLLKSLPAASPGR